MDMMERHRMIAAQPHPVTVSGGVVTFSTDVAGNISVSGSGNITVAGRNLYDKNAITHYYYINPSGVPTYISGYDWTVSDFIKVAGLSKVTYFGLSTPGSSNVNAAWYDGDKQVLSAFRQKSVRTVLDVPEGAVYLRMSVNNATAAHEINDVAIMPGETDASYEAYIGTSSLVSHAGYNSVWSDSGDVSVTYWKH